MAIRLCVFCNKVLVKNYCQRHASSYKRFWAISLLFLTFITINCCFFSFTNLIFFRQNEKKVVGSAQKRRVGRGAPNTAIFLFGLTHRSPLVDFNPTRSLTGYKHIDSRDGDIASNQCHQIRFRIIHLYDWWQQIQFGTGSNVNCYW